MDRKWITSCNTEEHAEEHNIYTESYEYGLDGAEWLRFIPLKERADSLAEMTWYRLNDTMFLYKKHPDIKDVIADYSKKNKF